MTDTPRPRGRPILPPPDRAKARELQRLSDDVRSHRTILEHTEQQRDALIRECLAEGWTHGQIALLTGLSRGRIGQL